MTREEFCRSDNLSSLVKRISYLANKDVNTLFPSRSSRFTSDEEQRYGSASNAG